MYIDINIPSGETKRIEFFEGNSPDVIATEFAALHGLSDANRDKLALMIGQQLQSWRMN